jgi:hypothetical protein
MRFFKPKHCALALTLISHVMPLSPVAEQVDGKIVNHSSTNNEESSSTFQSDEGEHSSLVDQATASGALHQVLSDDVEENVKKQRENAAAPLGEESFATAADMDGTLMRKADVESRGGDGAAKDSLSSDYIEDDELQEGSTQERAIDSDTEQVSEEPRRESTREAGPEDELILEDDTARRIHSSGTRRADMDDVTEPLSSETSAKAPGQGYPEAGAAPDADGGVTPGTTTSDEDVADQVEDAEDEDDDDDDIPVKAVNYAHKNAGAIILYSSPRFKGTSNLLVSDNDKYAISPCSDKKSVVISLSEDILVKVIVLSNFEKYSSSVKEFQVLGSQHYDPGNSKTKWHDLGKYSAKPTSSGEETFELKEASWTRYLKFRFITHFGNEHYCTITQIKVHGSTMVQGFHEQYDPWMGVEAELDDVFEAETETGSEKEATSVIAEGEEESGATPVEEEPLQRTSNQTTGKSADAESVERAVVDPEAVKVHSSNGAVKTHKKAEADEESATATKDAAPKSEGAAVDRAGEETSASKLQERENSKGADETVQEESTEVEHSESGPAAKVAEAVQTVANMIITVSAMVAASSENTTVNGTVSQSEKSSEDAVRGRDEGMIAIQEGNEAEVGEKENNLREDKASDHATSDQSSAADKGRGESDKEPKQATNGSEAKVEDKNKPLKSTTNPKVAIPKDEAQKQSKSIHTKAEHRETHQDIEKLNSMLKLLADADPSISCIESLKFSDFRVKLQNKAKAARAKAAGDATTGSAPNTKVEPIFKTLTDEIKGLQIHVSMYDQFLNELTVCYHQVVVHLASQNRRLETEHNLRLAQIDERLRRMEHPDRLKLFITGIASLRPGALTVFDMLQKWWTNAYVFTTSEILPVIRQNLETNESWRDAALLASGAVLALTLISLWKLVSNWMGGGRGNGNDIILPPHPGRKVRKKNRKKNAPAQRHNQVTSDESNS